MTALAPFAVSEATSRGRAHDEDPPAYRSAFQRDRDRIIHSAAFRRLEYKTQVFVNHEGDMFRTRLTHSIEVAQISRTIARALGLNEDLVEAIALAHDLGHTPFGHAGQDALNACMREHGGFEHNLQSLRVVDVLEERYASFPGLNLTYETREGILKHCSRKNARELGALGERFLNGGQPSLEAQVANLADEIAYNNHDVDDGLRAGLLDIETLTSAAFFREQYETVRERWPDLAGRRVVHETIRAMINRQATDLLDHEPRGHRRRGPGERGRRAGAPHRAHPFQLGHAGAAPGAQAASPQGALPPLPGLPDGDEGPADRQGPVRASSSTPPAACRTMSSGASRNGAAAIPNGPASSPTTSPA